MMQPYSPVRSYLAAFLFLSVCLGVAAQTRLGFDLGNSTVPVGEIHRGGPPPDGIPSIDDPQFTPVAEVDYLEPEDIVIGYTKDGVARAYPFRILIWHEIVNDTVAGRPIAVVYCPLCGTAMVFDRRYDGRTLTFGVSGLLYNSDVLMFDRQTKSLWTQLGMKSISGEFAGTELVWLPSQQSTWKAWREKHPDGEVLNTKTGHRRDYRNLPYQGYFTSQRTMFPYERNRSELKPKEWVAGIRFGGQAKAYPIDRLPADQWLDDQVGSAKVRVRYIPETATFEAKTPDGEAIPVVHAFWFAWQAFYPETEIRE